MSGHNQHALREHICSVSVAPFWEAAVREWELFGIEKSEEWGQCPCGQKIKEHCFLRNRINDAVTHVGNVCVNRFMSIETDSLFQGLRKIAADSKAKPNAALIDYAFRTGFLFGQNEYEFLTDVARKRILTPKQASWIEKINRRILSKTIVRRSTDVAAFNGGAQ